MGTRTGVRMLGLPVIVAGVAVLFGAPAGLEAQVPGTLGLPVERPGARIAVQTATTASQFRVFSGPVDHAAAGTGMRNAGWGTIRLRGIPPGATVLRAYLYWALICANSSCPSSTVGEFEGRTITGSLFGTAPQPCWTGSLIGAYRADVTGLMPGTTAAAVPNKVINGDYQLSGFPSGVRDGRNPWQAPVSLVLPLVEGATLVVVYKHPDLSAGRVWIHNGAATIASTNATLDVTNALSPAAPSPVSAARFTRFGADGQTGYAPVATTGTSEERTYFGSASAVTQIAGDGSTKDHDSDWNGHDGGPLSQLWDTRTTDVTGLLPAGASQYVVRYETVADCVTFIGYVLTAR